MYKRGISGIIVALILILLSLVAAGIVWAVIKNILTKETEKVSLGSFFLDLQIQKVKTEDNGDVKVTVKRGSGSEDTEMTSIAFIISDGEKSKTIKKETTLKELEYETFTISYSELGDIAFVKEILIAPGVTSESGKEEFGREADKEEFSTKQILENLGAVSWWKFDGDSSDEIGGNHGTTQGGIGFIDSNFGQAANFDGNDDYVDVGNDQSLDIREGITLVMWIKPSSGMDCNDNNNWRYLLNKGDWGVYHLIWEADWSPQGKVGFTLKLEDDTYRLWTDSPASADEWKHLAFSYDINTSEQKTYIDGELDSQDITSGNLVITNSENVKIGGGVNSGCPTGKGYFKGQIDEVMIFNKALMEQQVKGLYNLDLS